MANLRKYKRGVRTKITDNFYSTEFDCKCEYPECKWTIIDLDHVANLQQKRNGWRKRIDINSGYRCEKHNKDEGGSSRSRHKVSDATDIKVEGMSSDKVADDCENFDGLGRYDFFTHVDSRNWKARWNFKIKKKYG